VRPVPGRELLEAVLRLLRLTGSPRDFQVLAPGVRREIHWRLLNGPQGALLGQIGLADSRLAKIRSPRPANPQISELLMLRRRSSPWPTSDITSVLARASRSRAFPDFAERSPWCRGSGNTGVNTAVGRDYVALRDQRMRRDGSAGLDYAVRSASAGEILAALSAG